ncbi:glycosyltransferase family 2 protein [Metabacillus halosaccharovorans]|uniref:glycosyltransferase family 2 protein n=1 Tax=Metabacillus halosaccharovorans TaxID=930124 RepID=UPI001C1FB8D4|nr:glycosyltransferase family A protein [Metabacillus halosaccharovorans]MBU7594538.1 glycosyltransferase family 2 protein [Metabacillus halosaccharovorans]
MQEIMKPKISVIIPLYNVEDYIEECLNSIINQTYGIDNLEIILIDDQSKDTTYQIALTYKNRYPENVNLIKNERNIGIGRVRNLGVSKSIGEYFIFVDSDDVLPIDAIEKMTRPLDEDPDLDLVIGKHQNFYEDRLLNIPIYKQMKLFDQEAWMTIHEMQLKDLFLVFDLTPTWGKLYKTRWVKEKGIKATEGYYYEDAIFAMSAIFYANRIKFIKDVIYLYRRDNYSSITREFSRQKNDDYIKSIQDIREELLTNEFAKFRLYSELRLFNMWRTVIFINCVELIPDDELEDYNESIKEWLRISNEFSPSFIQRLPLFWRNIISKIKDTEDDMLVKFIYYFKRMKRVNQKYILKSIFNENERTFTFDDTLEIFTNIENKFNLLEQKVSGVYFWRLIRFAVFENILVQLRMQKLMGSENTLGNSSILEQIEKYHNYDNSPFYGDYSVENIVFDHSRRQKYKGKYIDYKSFHLLEGFNAHGVGYQVLEIPYNGEHFIESSEERKYLESLFLFLENKKNTQTFFNREENDLLLFIEEEFYKQTGVILEMREMIKKVIQDFKVRYIYFVKLFKKRQTKKVYLIGAWWHTAIIAAAQKLNIEVIDVQYAAFSKYHLGFSYENVNTKKIPYYPDKIYTWGEYWKNNGHIPIPENNKLVFGNKFMQDKMEEYEHIEKKKQILVISQGVHGEDINSTAYQLAKRLPEYDVIVKLHPKEKLETYVNRYNQLENFMYADNEIDLFKYFAESEYTIGVFSTAIFEAAAFGSKVILLNLIGVEHFLDLVNEGYFHLVDDADEIKEIIENKKESEKNFITEQFFSSKTTLNGI